MNDGIKNALKNKVPLTVLDLPVEYRWARLKLGNFKELAESRKRLYTLFEKEMTLTLMGNFELVSYLNKEQYYSGLKDKIWTCPLTLLPGEFDAAYFKNEHGRPDERFPQL